LSALENPATRQAVTAEREFLLGLGGGCSLPVAAYAVCDPEIRLAGRVATPDGKQVLDLSGSGQDAVEVGRQLALEAIRRGAAELLRPLPIEPKPL
jgi:hydroxymethylbilane synthase